MSEILISKFNSIDFKIYSNDTGVLNKLNDYFAIFKNGAQFSAKYKNKIWDGKIHFFNRQNNSLPIGLWNVLLNYCDNNDIAYKFDFDVEKAFTNKEIITKKKAEEFMKLLDSKQENPNFKSHNFQIEGLYKGVNNKRGIIRVSMGGGKSYIQYATIRYLLSFADVKKVLLIVPNKGLVNQMYGDMKSYKWQNIDDNVDTLTSERSPKDRKRINDNFDKKLLITTWQSITRKSKEWFEQFGAVLTDEAHGNQASSLKNILCKCNCRYKLGYTGTLHDSSDDKLGLYTVFAYLGPVLVDVSAKDLEDMKLTSKLIINTLMIKYPEEIKKYGRGRDFPNEIDYIENIENRHLIVTNKIDELWSTKKLEKSNVLILVKHIKHLKETEKLLKEIYPDNKIVIIYGGINAVKRDEIRATAEVSSNLIIIATYATVSTGFNIKNIEIGFFLSSYKSKFKVLQAIGRGLRLIEGGNNEFYLYDIVDDFRKFNHKTGKYSKPNHSYKHFLQRTSHYKKEKYDWNIEEIDFKLI